MSIEDEIWTTAAFSRALREFRGSVAGRWSDEASQRVSIRFLDPHEEDDTKMLDRRSQQETSSVIAGACLVQVDERAAMAAEVSRRLGEKVKLAGQENRVAEQLVEIARDHLANAQAMMPKIEQALRAAGCCCQGVPRQ